VTRALGQQFAEVHGLDIAPSMIAAANAHNTNPARCRFHLHCDHQLDLFADDSFDLIVAINVLRYISPVLQRGYIREFIRVIKPNGLVYFETCEAVGLRKLFPESLLRAYRDFRQSQRSGLRRQDRYQFAEADVRNLVSESAGEVLGVDAEPYPTLWRHFAFFVTK
jgi:ubiquinone/menaquinone biosynthesis C-methylase UbiE